MSQNEAIVEQWFARAVQAYPGENAGFLAGEGDPFRNPVGHRLRQALSVLLEQVLGEMDKARIVAALDDIVRIRAVQDLSASAAVAFVFELRAILRESCPPYPLAALGERVGHQNDLDRRIDQLALMAFDQYTRCREQLADIRVNQRCAQQGFTSLRAMRS